MPLDSHNPGDLLEPGSGENGASERGGADDAGTPVSPAFVRAAVERYEGPLTTYAKHVLGGDLDRARDVVQDAFLRLLAQDAQRVTPHLTEWLYTVCRNLAIDVRRK